MLRFTVHQLQLGQKHFILLPKLNSEQIKVLSRRFEKKGYSVESSRLLTAKSKEGTIRVDPAGFCWSTFDPADIVLPALPDVLGCPKERVSTRELQEEYFLLFKSGRATTVRFAPRIESSALWDTLRASGGCALSPDEHHIAEFLIRQAGGKCTMLTDFPSDESVSKVYGRKVYYESRLGRAEAVSTLRVVDARASRNSYLQRDGKVILDGPLSLPRKDLGELFVELGEWCYFTPV